APLGGDRRGGVHPGGLVVPGEPGRADFPGADRGYRTRPTGAFARRVDDHRHHGFLGGRRPDRVARHLARRRDGGAVDRDRGPAPWGRDMNGAAGERPATGTGMPPGVTTGDGPWQRLDRRMLLVHPVQAVMKFLPAVIGGAVLGISSGNPLWVLLGPIIVVPYGLALWFTTTYRMSPTHVELRTGVIQRKRLSGPRARIRSVDIEADPLHRILGLAAVVIGTGQEAGADDRFTLDALAADQVRPLRTELLAHTRRPHIAADGRGTSALDP